MAGLGVAIHSYNMLGHDVGQTKQFLEVQSKKVKKQHNMATSRNQMCMGAQNSFTSD